jgi:hypothetical protein
MAATVGDDAGETLGSFVQSLDPAVIETIVAEIEGERMMEEMARRVDGQRVVGGHLHDLDHRSSLRRAAGG